MSVKAAEKAAGAAVPISGRRVAIDTHGCKLNQADSSQLARRFQEAGCQLVPTAAEADIYILNTCTVTATADAKARQALRAARRANPHALVVAAGCYPQRAAAELAQLPAVSLVVGNTEKDQLVAKVMAALEPAAPPAGNPAPLPFPGSAPGRRRAMVKIQEGCDQVCAYCIVPKVRGRERSIPPETIIGQLAQRIAEGCREAALTGTQLGTYGFDLPGINLAGLLRRILAETNIERLRVSSLQPQEIGPELLDLWTADDRLCPHFHLPLQSGSDAILKVMRRRYTAAQFAATVERIRQAIPGGRHHRRCDCRLSRRDRYPLSGNRGFGPGDAVQRLAYLSLFPTARHYGGLSARASCAAAEKRAGRPNAGSCPRGFCPIPPPPVGTD